MSGSSDQFCFSTLFVPTWTCLNNGSTVSIVLDNMIWSENSGVGTTVPGGQVVRICGLIPPGVTEATKITVLGASFLSCGSVVDLVLDSSCTVLAHKPLCASHVFNLVELCAGVGLSSVGFCRAGFHHKCSVEKQPKLAELHMQIHPGVPVVCSDVSLDSTAGLIFAQCSDHAPSCQVSHANHIPEVALNKEVMTVVRLHFLAPCACCTCCSPQHWS